MDKTVIFAVAGSGKTTHIIEQLSLDTKSLIITYTNNNVKNLKEGILKKFGHFPENITLSSYFTFLYSFCFRPLFSYKLKTKGISYKMNPNRYAKQASREYFIDQHDRIYSNRIAKLLEIQKGYPDVISRLTKYFNIVFIDEIQDFAGHDFNFLRRITKANMKMIFVGDFYQHTFDTSRDGMVNKTLHNDYDKYKCAFVDMGITVDCDRLKKSYRCSPTICHFITENLGIDIHSHKIDATKIHLVETQEEANSILEDCSIVKLFYRKHYHYGCYSRNWGECKGENRFNDVCVVLNKTSIKSFKAGKLHELKPQTRNKLYVACSRARGDLYFVSDEFYKKHKRK